jgi:thiol:disulfide interchange protein/DsbC/DsbD-like thiol-disulfide interchange protein
MPGPEMPGFGGADFGRPRLSGISPDLRQTRGRSVRMRAPIMATLAVRMLAVRTLAASALAICMLTLGSFVLPALALESPPVTSKRSTATFITESDSVAPGGHVRIGLRLRLAPGWHTYWRNPGEAGVPVELAPSLSSGATAGPIEWPAPSRISEGDITTYGYSGEVILPVAVTLDPGVSGVSGDLSAHWLVCKDICIPEEASFRIEIPSGPGTPSAQAPLFRAHDRSVPRESPWAVTIAPDGTLFVRGKELSTAAVVDAWFIPDTPGEIIDGAAQLLSVRDGGFTLGLRLAKGFTADAGLRGVLSVRDRSGSQTDVAVAAVSGAAPRPVVPVGQALVFAFLGGIILNLMPCVFPILAMKAVGFAAGLSHGKARAHAVSYTAGTVTTFVGVAVALLVARSAGVAAGWGFQFASPIFVAAMAWLLFAVGLNLSGVFQVGGGFAGAGGSLASREGHWGSFFTGALAVLVATPCTAPFMAVAIASGLAAAPHVTVLIFVAMGLGLAAPYLALSAIPGLARVMPRPGAWMEVFRQVLAFPMYGAAVWLLWVISQEAGASGVLGVGIGFVLLGFAGWCLGVTRDSSPRGRRIGLAGAAVAVSLTLLTLAGIGETPGTAVAQQGSEAFTPARLAALRAEGRPVFVNVTAAWCVTCLVNERVAISNDAVQRAFASNGVAYLKGDWTRQDPTITQFLREQGRDGVPLYLYYGPNAAAAEVLPQILTESMVLDALGRRS